MSDAFKNLEKPGKNQGDQFRHTLPHWINPNRKCGSGFFVFYPGKTVFGLVVNI